MSLMRLNKSLKTTMMPLIWIFVAIFIIATFLGFTMGGMGGGSQSSSEFVFARVDGQEISQQEFDAALRQQYDQMKNMASFSGAPVTLREQAEAPTRAYNMLLEDRARSAAAEAEGVRVDVSEAQKALEKQVEERLAEVGKGATPEELRQLRDYMLSPGQVEAQQRQMAADKLREKLTADAKPHEVKVAHILIKTDGLSEVSALRKAEDLVRQARSGSDFAKLASANSADPGSKVNGGVVGWASAEQAPVPTGNNSKPDPNAPTNFVPEFTAAALRLEKGQVSNPVRTSFGYHVIKALETRPFKPKDEVPEPGVKPKPPAKDEKTPEQKRQEKVEQYRASVGAKIAEGLFSEWKLRLENRVEATSPWLKGYILEQKIGSLSFGPDGKPVDQSAKLGEAIAAYETAMKSNDPTSGRALAYKLATLYQRQAQQYDTAKKTAEAKAEYEKARTLLDNWAPKSNDSEMYYLQGEIEEKLGDKTRALKAFQASMEQAYNNAEVLGRLGDKFKALGRTDLQAKASAKMAEVAKRQEEQRKEQQARFQKMIEEQMKQQQAADKAKKAAEGAK